MEEDDSLHVVHIRRRLEAALPEHIDVGLGFGELLQVHSRERSSCPVEARVAAVFQGVAVRDLGLLGLGRGELELPQRPPGFRGGGIHRERAVDPGADLVVFPLFEVKDGHAHERGDRLGVDLQGSCEDGPRGLRVAVQDQRLTAQAQEHGPLPGRHVVGRDRGFC